MTTSAEAIEQASEVNSTSNLATQFGKTGLAEWILSAEPAV